MSDNYRIKDSTRSHFFMIPNMIDDMQQLSVYTYRLYSRFKRVAGEDGICYQSTRTLADACQMSTGEVSKSKAELIAAGLIEVTKRKSEHGGKAYDEINIVDIWAENQRQVHTERLASSPHELASSPHELASSPHELASSRSEIKEDPIKKTIIKKTDDDDKINDDDFKKVISLYEQEIGLITKTIADRITTALEIYPLEWFERAFQEAAAHNARTWAYAEACLKNWKTSGFQTKKKQSGRAVTPPEEIDWTEQAEKYSEPEIEPEPEFEFDPTITGTVFCGHSLDYIWDQFLGVMKERVDLRTFAAHIEPTYPLTYADGLLTVYAPEPDWCADRMTKLAERFLVGACNQAISVEFAP